MSRTTAAALAEQAVVAASDALGELFEVSRADGTTPMADLIVRAAGRRIAVEVKATAYATPERAAAIIDRTRARRGVHHLLVADRVAGGARALLQQRKWSWFDRSGHLHFEAPGVYVDRPVAPALRPRTTQVDVPVAGPGGLAVAYLALLDPTEPVSVRAMARRATLAPSTVSVARERLRDAGLLDRELRPLVPELFWALADAWSPARHWLASVPQPTDRRAATHDLGSAGWCLTDTAAALAWGAPLAAARPVVDVYVPGPAAITSAVRDFGAASAVDAVASVSVAPVAHVTAHRFAAPSGGMPLAHPLAVALELARDHARGREILEAWTPPTEFARVWA